MMTTESEKKAWKQGYEDAMKVIDTPALWRLHKHYPLDSPEDLAYMAGWDACFDLIAEEESDERQ